MFPKFTDRSGGIVMVIAGAFVFAVAAHPVVTAGVPFVELMRSTVSAMMALVGIGFFIAGVLHLR